MNVGLVRVSIGGAPGTQLRVLEPNRDLEPGLIEVLVPVRHVEGVRRKKLASGLDGPTQGPCKRGHSKKGTRPDIMTSTRSNICKNDHNLDEKTIFCQVNILELSQF